MHVSYLATVLAFVAMLVAGTAPPSVLNTQQLVCAKPPNGCGSQKREVSCTNWHGCRFRCQQNGNPICLPAQDERGKVCRDGRTCCVNDETCPTKPTRVPTYSPTVPTLSPTWSPTIPCISPPNGCESVQGEAACSAFNACGFNAALNKCQKGGCAGTYTPTASPTRCTQMPRSGGCAGLKTKGRCAGFNCCFWNGKVCKVASPPPCSSIRKRASCVRRAGCKFVNRRCRPK